MHHPDGWWRVGQTKLFLQSQESAFGPRLRMQSEHGDAVWILNIVPTASEAWLTEQLVAYKYGIPQSTWDHSNVTYGISELRAMYEALGDSTDKARMCLQAYGRDIDYPFFRKGDLWKQQSLFVNIS